MPSKRNLCESLETRRLFIGGLPLGFSDSVYASGLFQPVASSFLPDGRMMVTQKGGQLRIIKNGTLLASPALTLSVNDDGERGMLGTIFDPGFTTNHFIYIYYTTDSGGTHNRISRFTLDGDTVTAGSEKILVDLPPLVAAQHNSGSLQFGKDGKLYVVVGENANPPQAQNINLVFGKVLRFNSDGTIPTDDPFYNQNTGLAKAVWAYGFRNPFTFAFDPGSNLMFINDVGQNSHEEIDSGKAGANYGWPLSEGNVNLSAGQTGPIYTYSHDAGQFNGNAIAGGVFYRGSTFPSLYQGKYFFADFLRGWVDYIDPTQANPTPTQFGGGAGNTVDLDIGPDGALYYTTFSYDSTSKVGRIQFQGSVTTPVIKTPPANQSANVGASATFSVVADGANLSYQWQRNSANINGATASTYTIASVAAGDDGAMYRVIVSNSAGSATSSAAKLTVNNVSNRPPVITWPTPATTLQFIAGQPINFSAAASDPEDGAVPAANFTWTIGYLTGAVERPFSDPITGVSTGSFTPDTHTPFTTPNVAYRITLAVHDSKGATTTLVRDIQPNLTNVTLTTNPFGGTVKLDGSPYPTGTSFTGVAGVIRTIEAAVYGTFNGVSEKFVKWSDGVTTPTRTISTPVDDTTYTAVYGSGTTPPPGDTLPVLTRNPWNTVGFINGSVTFTAIATGNNLKYQWQRDGVNIAGATASTYTLSNIKSPDNGAKFRVVVSNGAGSVTSATGVLTATTAVPPTSNLPVITRNPWNTFAPAGTSVTFSVLASGDGLIGFQWQRNGVNIAGATAATYTLNNIKASDDGAQFRVIVSNSAGSVTSATGVLDVQ